MAQVLGRLPRWSHPDLLLGTDFFDDAGVFRLSDSLALVQTVDFFPPLVDDPFTFGRIAATNSLSDIYAMGAKPLTALNLVCFPDKDLPGDILERILAGGAERVREAGAVIVGGHSVRDQEIKYGLSVTGVVHPDRFIANAGCQTGDVLVLTKPIGSGVLTGAAKTGLIALEGLAEAIEVMVELSAAAAEAMVAAEARAATDITGFGLVGHAFEMAEASGVTLEIDTASVPLLDETLALAERGCLTRTHRATMAYLGERLRVDEGVSSTLVKVLCDAQTSGGLLISIAPEQAEALGTRLRAARCSASAVIGRVVARCDAAIRLR